VLLFDVRHDTVHAQVQWTATVRDGFVAGSREVAEAAAPGGGLVASTILTLALAWSNVEAPEAQAGFELPYTVRLFFPTPQALLRDTDGTIRLGMICHIECMSSFALNLHPQVRGEPVSPPAVTVSTSACGQHVQRCPSTVAQYAADT
jgi:hypothetical protein